MGEGVHDMTPFLRELYLRSNWPKPYKEAMETAICFDMTAVSDLANVLKQEFETDWNNFTSHGGLAVMPNDNCWFEIRDNISKIKYGWLCLADNIDEYGIGITVRTFEETANNKKSVSGIIQIKDDYARIINDVGSSYPKGQTEVPYYSISPVIAFMLILNAPYGIKRETPPRHKGHVREARRKGYELLPHHIITLDKSAPPKEYAVTGAGGSPKAFHFVRAHRRLVSWTKQRYTTVKAHWRGDPRLGIHRASYRVK